MSNKSDNIHAHHRERMRKRIAKNGLDSLQDHEVLEYLLYPFIPRKDTNPIAHTLLDIAGGTLEGVFNSPVEMLMNVPNMTYSASLFLANLSQLINRCNMQKLSDKVYLRNTERYKIFQSAVCRRIGRILLHGFGRSRRQTRRYLQNKQLRRFQSMQVGYKKIYIENGKYSSVALLSCA